MSLVFLGTLHGQFIDDEKEITRLIGAFRELGSGSEADARAHVFAGDYVHVTADGAMTTSWQLAPDQHLSVRSDQLTLRVFGDVAVATYRWRNAKAAARRGPANF